MVIFSILSFILLVTYLVVSAIYFGVPSMVSDTFYQHGKNGWMFTVVMIAASILMFPCMADLNESVAYLAFLGCLNLCFVGCAPNYISENERTIHKSCAVLSAAFCLIWCISIDSFPTSILALITMILSIVYKSRCLYIIEVGCFADVFVTYWCSY